MKKERIAFRVVFDKEHGEESYENYDTLYLEIKATDLIDVLAELNNTKIITSEDLENDRMVITHILRGEFRGDNEIYPGDKGEGLCDIKMQMRV